MSRAPTLESLEKGLDDLGNCVNHLRNLVDDHIHQEKSLLNIPITTLEEAVEFAREQGPFYSQTFQEKDQHPIASYIYSTKEHECICEAHAVYNGPSNRGCAEMIVIALNQLGGYTKAEVRKRSILSSVWDFFSFGLNRTNCHNTYASNSNMSEYISSKGYNKVPNIPVVIPDKKSDKYKSLMVRLTTPPGKEEREKNA